MTDPTNLGDVIATGQRRPLGSTSPFPLLPSSIVVPARYMYPEAQRHETIEVDPCSYEPFRKQWDADAAAVQATAAIVDKAAALGHSGPYGTELSQREYLVPLKETPSGGVGLGELAVGWTYAENPTMFPGVTPNWDGITGGNIRGFVHNHPASAGNIQPSGPDIDIMNDWLSQMTSAGRLARDFTMYIISQELVNGQLKRKILAFKSTGLDPEDAQEVNPNAQTCENS
jgi:hypothetical protein